MFCLHAIGKVYIARGPDFSAVLDVDGPEVEPTLV